MPRRGPRPTASTAARGYGSAHQRERTRLKPTVDAGDAYCQQPVCVMPTRWIEPGTPWDLGHTDDRTGYIGPTHSTCNQRAGASKGGRTATAQLRGQRICSVCKREYRPMRFTQRTCSDACSRFVRSLPPRQAPVVVPLQAVTVNCHICATAFDFLPHGRPRKYCSPTCAAVAQRRAVAKWRRANPAPARQPAARVAPAPHPVSEMCECGQPFSYEYRGGRPRKYCSEPCRVRANRRTSRRWVLPKTDTTPMGGEPGQRAAP